MKNDTIKLLENIQNNLNEDADSMKIDLDKEDEEFDKALNKFLNDTNSSKDESFTTYREHGWYYAKVKYKDNSEGFFYYHGTNGKCDAEVHKKDISPDSSGMELNELIKKVNDNLKLLESIQNNLNEDSSNGTVYTIKLSTKNIEGDEKEIKRILNLVAKAIAHGEVNGQTFDKTGAKCMEFTSDKDDDRGSIKEAFDDDEYDEDNEDEDEYNGDTYVTGIFPHIEEAFEEYGFRVTRFIDDGVLTANIGWVISYDGEKTQIECPGSWIDDDYKKKYLGEF